jgi:hypothetical protein
MKTKTYHILKQAVLGNELVKGAAVSVTSTSYAKALEGIGAVSPRLHSQHADVVIFRDLNNWTYLVTFER